MNSTSKLPFEGPRERLAAVGAAGLSDAELLALVLGTGTRGEPVTVLATRALSIVGGPRGLGRQGVGALAQITGIGLGKAARVVASVELGRRAQLRIGRTGQSIRSSRDVYELVRGRVGAAEREHFLAIALDAKNRPVAELVIGLGGLSQCPVEPADVFRALLREAAAGVVFAHNHPSGDPSPSADDLRLTERLAAAGELLGIRVLDHVIVTREGYFSFLDAGLLGP
jgi:DNA repair protein RadC